MNWLAHIYLSPGDEEFRIGNLLGDFVNKQSDKAPLTEKMLQGILMHIDIDKFTDAHPLFLRSRERLSPARQRLAGVLIDIFYDHFLAKNWTEYSSVPLEEFTGIFYRSLEKHAAILPVRLRRILPLLAGKDWLASYRTLAGIDLALSRIGQRLSVPERITGAAEELQENIEGLGEDFSAYFRELRVFASERSRYYGF